MYNNVITEVTPGGPVGHLESCPLRPCFETPAPSAFPPNSLPLPLPQALIGQYPLAMPYNVVKKDDPLCLSYNINSQLKLDLCNLVMDISNPHEEG